MRADRLFIGDVQLAGFPRPNLSFHTVPGKLQFFPFSERAIVARQSARQEKHREIRSLNDRYQ